MLDGEGRQKRAPDRGAGRTDMWWGRLEAQVRARPKALLLTALS